MNTVEVIENYRNKLVAVVMADAIISQEYYKTNPDCKSNLRASHLGLASIVNERLEQKCRILKVPFKKIKSPLEQE